MNSEAQIPYDETLDNSIALLKEGYLFIQNRMDRYETTMFATRLFGEKVTCITGKEAAEIFYDTDKFQRKGAAPKRVQQTLFGKKGVQTLDGQKHLERKSLFLALLSPKHQQQLASLTNLELENAVERWSEMKKIVLFDEVKYILCKVACRWANVPISDSEVEERANDFISMIYSFGKVGAMHWKGRFARNRMESWIRGIIDDVRTGKIHVEEGTVLYETAFFKNKEGQLLNLQIAAVELLNFLRPIVAIATYITFAALALHQYPNEREKLEANGNDYNEMFVHEVRRFYPFGPFVGARVKETFTWKGVTFPKGMLVLLDMYGTNHDPTLWEKPNDFSPERFATWNGSLYNFLPHGGGDPAKGHRCPGEGVTMEIMKVALDYLVNKITYDIPTQDLHFRLAEMPTLPKSGFVMCNVQKI